jgi:hypothetical protein
MPTSPDKEVPREEVEEGAIYGRVVILKEVVEGDWDVLARAIRSEVQGLERDLLRYVNEERIRRGIPKT